jgi:ABC-type multidrug transport system fused ATPase/permease subunit
MIFKYYKYFYSFIQNKILIGVILGFIVGAIEGLGYLLLLPLFKSLSSNENSLLGGDSNYQFILDFIYSFGFGLSSNIILIFIIIVFTLKGIIKFIEGYFSNFIQFSFILKVRKLCVDGLTQYTFKSFIKSNTGKIQNNLTVEATKLVLAFKAYFSIFQNGIFLLVYLILALFSNFSFTIIVSILAFFASIVFIIISRKSKEISLRISRNGDEYIKLISQSITYFKYLKSTNRFGKYSNKLNESVLNIENGIKSIGLKQSFLISIKEPIMIMVVICAVIININFIDSKIELILISLVFIWKAIGYLVSLQFSWNSFMGYIGSVDNVIEFSKDLDSNKENYGANKFNKFKKSINFNTIYFSYQEEDWILKNINHTIFKNTTVAFIGESGSGKTTLVNILTGLLLINNGSLTIDGIDSQEIDMRTFQERIGYITQEPVIFDDNVFNNVTFWDEKTSANLNRFWEALRKASILEFVESLPEKENAPLGNNGIMASGGQKQRLSIARELYKDIDILIMDEATSALDSETEKAIQENIDALKGQYTIIIIAHRLSTIKNADEIVLMAKGEIIDKGSFSELIGSNETFKRMVNLQEL